MEEKSGLMSGSTKSAGSKGGPDWSRFGLNKPENNSQTETANNEAGSDAYQQQTNENDLFRQEKSDKPWYKANFLITEPIKFGTWDGVFTSCMLNIFGVVIFLRTGWMVGEVGIGYSVLIIMLTISVAIVAVLSGIGVCERCKIESGGVYFLLSHVLGARFGAAVGILYCFGQAVACSLYTMGFGESISDLIKSSNIWVAKGIAISVVLLLLGINLAGVKWVIRLQLVLLFILFVGVLDFLVGSFVKSDPENGVIGYHLINWKNNSGIAAPEGQKLTKFFDVFGVFFPTATGVFAGINMSGDLRDAKRNIPIGTLSAVGVSTFLYLVFALVLGATCMRDALQSDYMIAARVAWFGPLLLTGLYVSSLSAALGGVTGSPRVLQAIAQSTKLPLMGALGHSWGANKVPVFSLMAITFTTLVFILIGNVNVLGPIVTMPFMITYAAVDYAYFALAMSFDIRRRREARFAKSGVSYDSIGGADEEQLPGQTHKGYDGPAAKRGPDDLDSLFPERTQPGGAAENVLFDAEAGKRDDAGPLPEKKLPGTEQDSLLASGQANSPTPINMEITRQPTSWYSIFINRYVSLVGIAACYAIMFSINWIYALASLVLVFALFIYIGQANPGVFPGVAEFSLWKWCRDGVRFCLRGGRPDPHEEVLVPPRTPAMNTQAEKLTDENEDFSRRGRYHQSQPLKESGLDQSIRE